MAHEFYSTLACKNWQCLGGAEDVWMTQFSLPDPLDEVMAEEAGSGRLEMDLADAPQCIADLADAGCDAIILNILPPSCFATDGGGMLVPQEDAGGPCVTSLDCRDGYCDTRTLTCPGVCRTWKNPGDSCLFNEACISGTVCDGGYCWTPPLPSEGGAVGKSCGDPANCQIGAYCVLGYCYPVRREGEPCTGGTLGAGDVCEVFSHCGLVGDGGTVCVRNPSSGACSGLAAVPGHPLHLTETQCLPGAWCVTNAYADGGGYCGPLLPDGSDCEGGVGISGGNEQCASMLCDTSSGSPHCLSDCAGPQPDAGFPHFPDGGEDYPDLP